MSSSSASLWIVPTVWRMSWTRYVSSSLFSANFSIQALADVFRFQWYPEVLHFCPTTPLILVGLKTDLRFNAGVIEMLKTHGMAPVSPEQGKQVAKRMSATYAECSSIKMEGVHEVFDLAMDIAIGVPGAAPIGGTGGEGHGRTRSASAGGGASASGRPMGPETKRRKKKGCVIL